MDPEREMMMPGRPIPAGVSPAIAVPRSVSAVAGGRPARLVWHNEAGGLTYEIGAGPGRCFAKWMPAGSAIDLAAEAARLAWARAYAPVPRLLASGRDETGSWLVTEALPGASAASERWQARPRTAVTAIGAGLAALHAALPVAACPFSWSAADRLAVARERAAAGQVDPARFHEEHQSLSLAQALDLLADPPEAGRLVVCHGDSCAPNTLIGADGHWTGHVDLGELGVADPWADLAIATWSTGWNYGPGWEETLLAAYGAEPDPARTSYYRLLWEFGP